MFKKFFSMHTYLTGNRLQNFGKLDWAKQEQLVMAPFEYIQKLPSKHHRLMAPAFNHWLRVPKEKVKEIEDALQTLHTSSLILDDIEDESASRYGKPSAHHVYSIGLTTNAASNALIIAGKKVSNLGHPLASKIFFNRVEEMHLGQGIDLYWRDNLVCPTEAEHIDMLKKKAASFFILLVELLQLFSDSEKDFTRLAMNIGIFYPILDDYYNLFHPQALERLASVKQSTVDSMTCSDITECKFTLPIIHAMQFPDVSAELTNILKQRTIDPKLQNRTISLLKKHGSDEYMRDTLRTLELDIRSEIQQKGGNVILTRFMDDLTFRKHEPGKNLYE